MFSNKVVLFVLALVVILECVESNTKVPKHRSDLKKSLKDCVDTYSFTCLKLDIVTWVEKLNEADKYDVLPGVSVVRENNSETVNKAEVVAELAREFPNDAEARLDNYLFKQVSGYLRSHSVKLNLLENEGDVVTGRAKGIFGKKGGGLGIILALGGMMKSMFGALALSGIAAMAAKALMLGLVALVVSAVAGFRSQGQNAGAKSISVYDDRRRSDFYKGYSAYERNYDVPLPLGLQPTYQPHY